MPRMVTSPSRELNRCRVCGYEGGFAGHAEGDSLICPACSHPWGGKVREMRCTECDKRFPVADDQVGKMIICPGCHTLLGCLLATDRKEKPSRSPALYAAVPLILASALGYSLAFSIWSERIPWKLVNGVSVILWPVTWTVVGLWAARPGWKRRPQRIPPGVATCVAVCAASLLSLWHGGDQPYLNYTAAGAVGTVTALRAVQPLPLAAAVVATWVLRLFDRSRKPEPSGLDRLARCLALYWLLAGLTRPLAGLFL